MSADKTPDKPDSEKPKTPKPIPKMVKRTHFSSLGATRDYFAVQLEQDATWNSYRPED